MRGDLFDYIIWNLHYQATGRPETARPSIGAWFAKDPGAKYERTLSLREYTSENEQLVAPPPLTPAERRAAARERQAGQGLNPLLAPIPPNDPNWTVTGIGAFQNDALLQSLFLHMHVRGKDVTYVLTYPDGREEILLRVPNYSFDWQFEYELAEPIRVPAGSTVKAIARYDNSRANRLNPAPHKEVYWSEQSWDDMFLANVKYTLDEDARGGPDAGPELTPFGARSGFREGPRAATRRPFFVPAGGGRHEAAGSARGGGWGARSVVPRARVEIGEIRPGGADGVAAFVPRARCGRSVRPGREGADGAAAFVPGRRSGWGDRDMSCWRIPGPGGGRCRSGGAGSRARASGWRRRRRNRRSKSCGRSAAWSAAPGTRSGGWRAPPNRP